ncbi:MAG: cysteine synthase A, partial [Bacteroidales bacterium]|nr:cysteine synthase A [Bacteroidales bacterium]
MKHNSIIEAIGKTPIIKLNNITEGIDATVYVKMESMNPGSSVKDRLALAMLEKAEKDGMIDKDTHVVEPSSGNTGVGLAMVCAVKGYCLTIVMPESVTKERRQLVKAYGAKVVLTPAAGGMKASIAKAEEIAGESEKSFIPMQFENESNAPMHRRTTAQEIWEDTNGEVDIFIAGVGTGGTVTGTAQGLHHHNLEVKAIAIEPEESPVISGGSPGPHKIQGIGAGFIPAVLDTAVLSEVIKMNTMEAFEMTRRLAKEEGILGGISSGANVA